MRLLLLEPDRSAGELSRSLLEREGHGVQWEVGLARGLEALATGRFDALVFSTALGRAALEELQEALGDLARAARARPLRRIVVLIDPGERADPRLAELVYRHPGTALLPRPVSLLDLADLLRGPVEEPSAPPARAGRLEDDGGDALRSLGLNERSSDVRLPASSAYLSLPLHAGNVRAIGQLWAERASGELRLERGPAGARGWMVLAEGGALDSDGWELLSAALHGGELRFQPRRVHAAGDRLGLGAMLFGRVRRPDGTAWLQREGFLAVQRGPSADVVAILPVHEGTRRLLAEPDPSASLGEQIARRGLPASEVGADLQALVRLGLAQLGEPTLARPARPAPARPAAPRPPPAATPDAEPTSVASRRSSSVGSEAHQQLRRLRAELSRLRGAPPAVLLGIPSAADAALVQQSADRLRARYAALGEDPALGAEGRELAREMVDLIERARVRFAAGGPLADSPLARLPRLRALAEAGQLAEALRGLKALQEQHPFDAEILAELAWWRRLDESLSLESRQEEALTEARLAVQLDPESARARFTLARLLAEQGALDGAREEARRALRLDPQLPGLDTLLQRLLDTPSTPTR